MTAPFVTILIPAYDEDRWIDDCIAAVAAQDHPHDRLEVVVAVDGASTDGTEVRAKEALAACDFARFEVLRNPDGGTPGNLNAGLAVSTGEILCRVDARSRIPADYVRRCADLLRTRSEVAVVGGSQVAVATSGSAGAAGIARALNNRWGMGLSRYRRGAASGPADTVYLGAFRTADLRGEGGWNPAFPTNQDFELNRRMAARGIVWFEAELPVGYVPRPDLASLYRQYRRFGAWKAHYWCTTGDRPQIRQLALLVGVPAAGAVTAVALVAARGRRRAWLVAALAGAATLVEMRGSRGPRGDVKVHATSAAALATVGVGWLHGAWSQILRGDRRP